MSAHTGFVRLMALPINDPERMTLRERVPGSDEAVIRRAMKYGSASPEFRSPHVSVLDKPLPKKPIYPAWLGTRVSPPRPFESGKNCLPGMEAFAAQVRR